MEQEQLNDRLLGAERVPVHSPSVGRVSNSREGSSRVLHRFVSIGRDQIHTEAHFLFVSSTTHLTTIYSAVRQQEEEDDDEAQLRRLQAEMAM